MILKIHKRIYDVWWGRLYTVYKITIGSVLLIDGKYYNIDGFEGRLSLVHVEGKLRKIGIRRARKYRYAALKKRGTICNHINLSLRYKHDITNRYCDSCYVRARCSMVGMGWRKRTQLAIKDLMIMTLYFEENEE